MLTELAQNSLLSSLVIKLFLEGALIMVLRSMAKRDTENILFWAYGATGFLILRDIAATFIPGGTVLPFTLAVFPFFLPASLWWRSEKKKVLIFGLAVLGVGILAAVFAGADPRYDSLRHGAAVASSLVALLLIKGRSRIEGKEVFPISWMGKLVGAVGLILPAIFSFLWPESDMVLNSLVIPASYLCFIFAALDYGYAGVSALIVDRDGLAENIDTLYGFVLHSSDALRAGGDLNKLMNYVARTLAEESAADGSLVLMVDDFEDSVSAYALSGNFSPISEVPDEVPRSAEGIREWLTHMKLPLGEGIIGETAKSGKAVYLRDAFKDPRIVVHPSFPVGSLIAVPFLVETRVIGVGVVVRRKGADPFTDKDFDRSSLLADFSSLVINNIFSFQEVTERSDIDTAATIAEDIQRNMRPKRIPKIPALSIGVYSESARGVCSDYYDIIAVRKDRIYLVIGDVAGKGIQAGLIMVMIRAILHLVTNTDKDAATILSWINRGITGKIDLDHFATLQIIVMDPTTGDCEYANAGHKPLLVWKHAMGLVDAIESGSVPIGVEKGTEFSSVHFSLDKEDVLLLYTDGVVETINPSGRQYGVKSLTGALHKFHTLSTPEIAQKIRDDIKNFIGNARQHDDQTVLVVKARRQN